MAAVLLSSFAFNTHLPTWWANESPVQHRGLPHFRLKRGLELNGAGTIVSRGGWHHLAPASKLAPQTHTPIRNVQMSDALQRLTEQMRDCRRCPDLPLGPRPIFQLDPRARILIVGQAPGRVTHAKNRPFDDPSGTRLRDWLGMDRTTFYTDKRVGIFPMGLCFPGTGKGGDLPPRPECAATWRGPVLRALERIELTLLLGRYAIAWHLPHLKREPVTAAVRLSWAAQKNVFVLPHPSPRNNRWLRQNSWFEAQIVPDIRTRVAHVLSASPKAGG